MPRYTRIVLILVSTALILGNARGAAADYVKIRVLDVSITMGFKDPTVDGKRRIDAARTMIKEEWKSWLEGGHSPSDFVVLVFDREVWQVKNEKELDAVEPKLKGGGKEEFNEALELAFKRAWKETQENQPRRSEIFYYTDGDLELDHDTLDKLSTAVVGAKTTEDKQAFFTEYDALVKAGLIELYFMVLQGSLKSDQRSIIYGLRGKILGGPPPVRPVEWCFERWLTEQRLSFAEGERKGLVAPYELPPLVVRIVTLPGYTTEKGKFQFKAFVGDQELDFLSSSFVHCWRGQAELRLSLREGTMLPEGLSSITIRGVPVDFSPAEIAQGKQPVAQEQVLPDCIRVAYFRSQLRAPVPSAMDVIAGNSARESFSWQIVHPQEVIGRGALLPIECSLEVTPSPADGVFELKASDATAEIRWPNASLVRWKPSEPSEEITVRVTKAPMAEGTYKLALVLKGYPFEGGETQSAHVALHVRGEEKPGGVETSQVTKQVRAFPGVPVVFDAFSVKLADDRTRGGELLVGPVPPTDGIEWATLVTPSGGQDLSKAVRIQLPEQADEKVTCKLRVQIPRDDYRSSQSLSVPLKFMESESKSGMVNGKPQDALEFQISAQLPKATVSLGECAPLPPGKEAKLATLTVSAVDPEAAGRYLVFGRVPPTEGIASLRLFVGKQNYDLLADDVQVAIPAKGSGETLDLKAEVPREGYRAETTVTVTVKGMGVLVIVNGEPTDDLTFKIKIPPDVTAISGQPPTQPLYEKDEKTFAAFSISPTNPEGGGSAVSVSAVGIAPNIRSAIIEGVDILRNPASVRVPARVGEFLEVPIKVSAADKLTAEVATLRLSVRGRDVLVNGAPEYEVLLPIPFGERLPEFEISGCPAFPAVVLLGCPSRSRVPVTVSPARPPAGAATVHVRAANSDLPAGSEVALRMADKEVPLPSDVSLTSSSQEWTLEVLLPVDDAAPPGQDRNHSFQLVIERREPGFLLRGWEAQPDGAVMSPPIELRATRPQLVLKNEKAESLAELEIRLDKGQIKGRSQAFSLGLVPELDKLDKGAVDRSLTTVELQALAEPESPNERCALTVVDAKGKLVSGSLHSWITGGGLMSVEMDTAGRENRARNIPFEIRIGAKPEDTGGKVVAPAEVKGTAMVIAEGANWWIPLLVLAVLAGVALLVWKFWPMIKGGGSLEGARVELEDGTSIVLTGRRAVIGRGRAAVRMDFADVAPRHAVIVATSEEGRALLLAKAGEAYQTSVSGGSPVGPEGAELYDGSEFSIGAHRLTFHWPELSDAGQGVGSAKLPTSAEESDDLAL